jgi:hypothetical protein
MVEVQTVIENRTERTLDDNELIMMVTDMNEIVINFSETIYDEEGPRDSDDILQFSVPEASRHDFANYLRQVADMLERKK